MTDPQEQKTPSIAPLAIEESIQPSWKPMIWLLTSLFVLIGLGELVLEFGLDVLQALLDILENIYLVLVEAPEEILEDYIEEWLRHHYPHEADRYSELITAIGLTPVKILVGLLLLRWGWRYSRRKFLPQIKLWGLKQIWAVRLAWRQLAWPFKIVLLASILGGLILLI
jgi:hypothetical protein